MHNPMYKEFGKRLTALRIKSGLKQSEVAEKLGTVQSTYSGYELGNRKVTLELIIALSKIFDVSPDFLINGTDDIKIDDGCLDHNVKKMDAMDINEDNERHKIFFEVFDNLSPPLQDYLLKTAKDLLDTQSKINPVGNDSQEQEGSDK